MGYVGEEEFKRLTIAASTRRLLHELREAHNEERDIDIDIVHDTLALGANPNAREESLEEDDEDMEEGEGDEEDEIEDDEEEEANMDDGEEGDDDGDDVEDGEADSEDDEKELDD